MNAAEVRALLGICASFDNRQPAEATAAAWTQVLGDVPFVDARDAVVEHYTHSREWVMPADIRRIAKAKRQQRIEHADTQAAIPAADPDDVNAYLTALRQGRHRDADRTEPRPVKELLAGAFQRPADALTPEQNAARARELRKRLEAS